MRATWKPHEKHGRLTTQSDLPDSVYAFPEKRKEPLTDARHVRNAVARFDQVTGVTDAERELAFANIKKAAKYYEVDLSEESWHELGVHPQKNRSARAKRAAATRKQTSTKKRAGAMKKSSGAAKKSAGAAKKGAGASKKGSSTTRKRRSAD